MYKDYPLTKQQLGLWIEQKLHPDNTSYNTCVKVRLTGKLDEQRFLNASTEVIDFFDTLKVYFVEKDGKPIQRIDPQVEYLPELIDISDGEKQENPAKAQQAKQILSDKLNTAIDLTRFPIMRASLIKTAEHVYYFIGMVPHIVSDGRSAILYLESLSIAYNQGKQGLEETYGTSKKNWQDFQQAGLDQIDEQQYLLSKSHWQDRLKNASHYFDYSYGKQLVDIDDKRGERVYFDLSEQLATRLKIHCKENRTTLFNVLVCAFSIFIHKYYQLNDILIGYPVNIRPPGYKHFFGFFVNILPIRVDMRDDPDYQTLLNNIHQIRKQDKKHQKYPALDIVADIRELLPDFDGRVFNLSMAQTVSRLFNLELEGVESQPLDSEYYDVNDDFSLSYELIEQRIGLWFEYRKALFDREFINQAMGHIESILLQMLDYPQRKLSEFELLDEKQKLQLIQLSQEMKTADSAPVEELTIVSLFESQVNQAPEDIAIIDGQSRYNYQQLNQQANQLARRISQISGHKKKSIAISMERGFDLIVGLLAVLKSGCYYVPIPVNYPDKRTAHILQQSQAELWITSSTDKNVKIVENSDLCLTIFDLQKQKTSISEQSKQNVNRAISKHDRAYIIYTSGSTGEPKGVTLQHKNVVPRLQWLKKYFNFSNKDRVLQNTDFSFDVSVAEIFWPLISGATLVISDQQNNRDANYLLSLIKQQQVTCCCMVPSLLNALLAVDDKLQLSGIKQILSAGEALPDTLRKDFYNHPATGCAELYNFYGPTEAAIYASFEKVSRNFEKHITIGRPLGDTSLMVLDEKHNLLPKGVVGELYIGGAGVAQGYKENQALTQASFIKDPFSEDKNGRLYRTGDLAKYNFDERLEYVGRIDSQVKIRGFRVELSEIENTLLKCQQVLDAAVIDYKKEQNQTQLVAYLVIDSDAELSSAEVVEASKDLIVSRLPNYMLPSFFSIIEEIPRSPSGKLNRKLLPGPQHKRIASKEFKAASGDKEILLVEIWSRLLSIEPAQLSTNQSFFDLGGDSLMAIQFVSLAEQQGLYFEIGDLFELRNIAELAAVAKISSSGNINNEMISGSYPLLPRQVKFFEDDFINPNHWNRTFSFSLSHRLDIAALQSAIKAILTHHDNLRIRFAYSRQTGWQQVCEAIDHLSVLSNEVFEHLDISNLSLKEQNKKMQKEINLKHQSIDLSKAPLIKMIHFSTAKDKGQLVIIFHHLLLDMVSSRLIFEDLSLAYQSARNHLTVSFPAKTTSVKEWVIHLQQKSQSQDFSKSLAYWGNMPDQPTPLLPLDIKSNAQSSTELNKESSAKLKSFVLDAENTKKLLVGKLKEPNLPIQDFLLASLFEVVSEWSACNSMMVSTCGHGRQVDSKEYNLSRTVGWLNTVYPVLLSFDQTVNIKELASKDFLTQIQAQLAKVPESNIDYNVLRYYLKHSDILKHKTPSLFFNYVGQIDTIIPKGAPFILALDLPGLAGIDGENHLCYQLYFEAGVIGEQLIFRLTYSEHLFNQSTIDALANRLLDCIKARLGDICD